MSMSADRRLLLERMIRTGMPPAPTPVATSGPRIEPASFAQRRLWFLEQLQQSEVPYTLHAIQQLHFAMNAVLLERAVNDVVCRHDALRTTFLVQDGEPMQCVAAAVHVPLHCVDLTHLPPSERQSEALRQMGLTIARRFDLERGPLLRIELYRLDTNEWVFLLAVHHIVFDGPSFPIFFREMEVIYRGLAGNRPVELPRITAQYPHFAREQRLRLTPQRIAQEVEFWRAELDGVPMLDLPTDRRRSATPAFRGAQKQVSLSPALIARLQQRAAAEKTSLFVVMLAGLFAALSRICGQEDFAIGLPVTGRDTAERQEAIGFFVDTLVVRVALRGDPSTGELITRVRDALYLSLAHGSLPFDMLVQHLRPQRDLGMNPYFQVGFQLMLHPAVTAESDAFDVERSSAMFDLGLDLWMQGKGINGRLQFNTDLFDPPAVDLVLAAFHQALEWLTHAQRRLSDPMIVSMPGTQPMSIVQGKAVEWAERSAVEVLAEIAKRQPDLPAIVSPEANLTYAELMIRAAHLRGALQRRGVQPGALVAIDLQRSLALPCLQLATLQARCAFLCLDPQWPSARRQQILQEARPALVVDKEVLAAMWQEREAPAAGPGPNRDDPAYVIFTSGSTGPPKGVVVEHGGLLNVTHAQRNLFHLNAGRRVAQLASPTFDASIFETILALGGGATLVIAPPEVLAGEDLALFLERNGVDTVVLPPTVLGTLEPSSCPSLRLVCVAGESCPADLAARWRDGRDFWNLYGPTEATIWATCGRATLGSRVSIGQPITNLTTLVVDEALRIVPVGMAGELCIAGAGLARGYLGRPEATAQRFVTGSPSFEGRLYRSGDRVRQTPSGELLFLGRVDRQLKVRGVRIEPDEIEAVLRAHPRVSGSLICARSIEGSEPFLVAYLQCPVPAEEIADECRRLLREQLPSHMMPSHFVVLREFPRLASGKVDVQSLPAPADLPAAIDGFVEPSTQTEHVVAELMARAAHVTRIGATDDFFRIGGHSLAAAQLVSRARAIFKADLTIRDVFQNSTVRSFATRIDALMQQSDGTKDADDVPLVRLPRAHETS